MNKKKNILLVDNPIDVLAILFVGIAMLVLSNLYRNYLGSIEYPNLSSDCFTLLWKGSLGLAGIIMTRILLHTKKGRMVPIIANQFEKQNLFDMIYGTACYMAIQLSVMIIKNLTMFQVAAGDVYAFYLSAAVIEELLYRGFVVMLAQVLLAKLFKPKSEGDAIFLNIICCLLSGSIFAAVHVHYWSDPFLMTLTFLGGISQAAWYIKSKNLFVVFIPHAVINWMASGSLLQTLN